jgi:alkanesulfonate monooxygenase SsuD/methylene tetrahydromethanopterin reductase-like flavin-dependent oxidoreductase (luciferase family)
MTKGRVAWNVVTSYYITAAQARGLDDVKPSAGGYEAAHEYIDLCYQYVLSSLSFVAVTNSKKTLGTVLGRRSSRISNRA